MSQVLTGDAARILQVSANHVRYLERTGRLTAHRVGGMRVYQRADVERLAVERLRQKQGRAAFRPGS